MHRSIQLLLHGGIVAALAFAAGPARAECDKNGDPTVVGGICYKIRGSDTLFDIMTEAIRQARLDGGGTSALALAAKDLHYLGTGSGNGETAIRTALATPAPNGSLGSQSIAPMSRNFRPSIIDPASSTFTARSATALTANGHAAWWPSTPNVPGLDAAIFVVKSSSPLENLTFSTFVDTAGAVTLDKGVINNSGLATALGNPGAFNQLTPSINYNSVMSVILSGVDGSGTLAACADPRRVQAVQDLAQYLGVATIQHFIRRDENSGTTDTFKDRIMVVNATSDAVAYPRTGGRFCNGASIGGISGSTLQQGLCSANRSTVCTADVQCDAITPNSKCWFNLNNPDYDPIRRPCLAADATNAPTSCTDMTTGLRCQASDGNVNCTQGLIVALSDTDPGSSDITTSIGNRVGSSAGDVIGFAAREAAQGALTTKALAINTHRSTDVKVRNSLYLLARRLFIQNSFANSVSVFDIPTNNGGGGGPNGGSDQLTKEQLLWTGFLTNRFLMDPIVRQFNFIRCGSLADGDDPDAEGNNLCSQNPPAATAGAFGNYQPTGALAGANGGTPSINYLGRVPTVYAPATAVNRTTGNQNGRLCTVGSPCSCSATTPCQDAPLIQRVVAASTQCVSGNSGAGLVCPDAPLRASGAPCSVAAECTSNACIDSLGQAVPGELHSLYCQ
jgi:hypothetical protein